MTKMKDCGECEAVREMAAAFREAGGVGVPTTERLPEVEAVATVLVHMLHEGLYWRGWSDAVPNGFSQYGLARPIVAGLREMGYEIVGGMAGGNA